MNRNFLPKTFIALVAITTIISGNCQAQQATVKTDSVVIKRAQTVFMELLGPGLTFSGNYDTRFSNRRDGVGGRIGLGYFASESESIFSVPVQLNYLLGKGNKFFEVGLGATYFSINDKDDYNSEYINFNNDDKILGTMTFGYRYQPQDDGFSFRAAFNPIFNSENFLPWFGISFGYVF